MAKGRVTPSTSPTGRMPTTGQSRGQTPSRGAHVWNPPPTGQARGNTPHRAPLYYGPGATGQVR